VKLAVFLLSILAIYLWVIVTLLYLRCLRRWWASRSSNRLFPVISTYSVILFSLFIVIALLNLFSLIVYRYPVTTTLRFNLGASLSCWITGIFVQCVKYKFPSSLLPLNRPWYLIPFLCIVEFISILVRPITLCFRLLANMTAGHVLISLIVKISLVWPLGRLFGCLELIVCFIQGFVFSMLIRVYLDEAISH